MPTHLSAQAFLKRSIIPTMFDLTAIGKWVMLVGIGIVALGAALWLAGKFNLPLGQLPGDVRVEGDGFSFYFPIVSSIVASVVLTIILNLLARWFNR